MLRGRRSWRKMQVCMWYESRCGAERSFVFCLLSFVFCLLSFVFCLLSFVLKFDWIGALDEMEIERRW
jgi:hypothetical protein